MNQDIEYKSVENPNVPAGKFWYALYTKPRHEFKALSYLNEKNIENYLPTVVKLKQWSDRKKKITEPVFKGYIFMRGNEKERYASMQNDAVVKTVCFNGKPAKIPDWEIDNLRKIIEKNEDIIVKDLITTGTKIRITDGPFNGVEGIVVQSGNDKLLGVSIELLRRTVLVRLPKASVTKNI